PRLARLPQRSSACSRLELARRTLSTLSSFWAIASVLCYAAPVGCPTGSCAVRRRTWWVFDVLVIFEPGPSLQGARPGLWASRRGVAPARGSLPPGPTRHTRRWSRLCSVDG